jgi:ferredoxin--NADP+ reductase
MGLETITNVKHYTKDLFSFKTTRDQPWKTEVKAGQFTMLGMGGEHDVTRAYSIANTPEEKELEFLSIKVEDGALTSKLKHIKTGDRIEVGTIAKGTLLLDNILPGKTLWLLSTGTGLAPFLSIGRDPKTHQYFERVIITHTVRTNAELVFQDELESSGCKTFQTVTQEETTKFKGRITDYIYDGSLFNHFGTSIFDKENDRIMICGNYDFNKEIQGMLSADQWHHGTNKKPGHFVQEKAFVG